MGLYRDLIAQLVPPWLVGPEADAITRALGQELDHVLALVRAGVKAHIPVRAPDGGPDAAAIAAIGAERLLERASINAGGVGVPETDAQYLARVAKAWDAWAYGGTANGLLQALWDLGYHTAHLNIRNGLSYSLDGSRALVVTPLAPGAWRTGALALWSHFDIFFPSPPTPATGSPSDWTGAVPAAGSVELEAIKRIVRRWKPAWTMCRRIMVVRSGLVYGWPAPPSAHVYGAAGVVYGGNTVSVLNLGI